MSPREKAVSKTYARVFFEVTQKEDKTTWDKSKQQLGELNQLLTSSKELSLALQSPVTSAKEKSALVEVLCKKIQAAPLLRKFLLLLARKGRLGLLSGIYESLDGVRLEASGGLLGVVTSADPISAADIESLSKAFAKKLGKQVEFVTMTDSNLLAGLKVSVNGVTYDGSLRAQLERLREQFSGSAVKAH